jgi:hypothetical protein
VYLRDKEGPFTVKAGEPPPGLERLREEAEPRDAGSSRGRVWDFPASERGDSVFGPLHPECAAPLVGRDGVPAGLLVLGPRLSEEPYSRDDKRLLESVTSQAGTALDNIRLGEQIAEKIETERRTSRETEIAREVQLRLLPQWTPDLKTMEVAAHCIQARSVGGDFFDFLNLGESRVGFVLADVSGKGVHAALFFAIYNDATRDLTFSNCGHNPPMLLRCGGAVDRLEATATVIGLFEEWECGVGQVSLEDGDLLAVFSDGVSEAMRKEEEFGEARLLEALRSEAGRPPGEMLERILDQVQEFSAGALSDDLTLLIARARPVH